ncbi:TatD family hydrolase [Lentisphaera profundi]|uniref:TatD family hydrolase n=1 Tax=Lentisphaera profundi TaxID=1658616 RepID=A0ABY7VW22_9BACT|nr:TatD family hydrolase [Lentisphaera profundi]WDE96268.1 TatD family hydrolase [Lentisphaera profundi]
MFWNKNKFLLSDAHCHLLDFEELPEVEIPTFCVTTRPEQFCEARKLAANNSLIRAGLGLFPLYIKDEEEDILAFEKQLKETHFIGEVGLDFTVDENEQEKQIRIFEKILDLAEAKGNCVLSLHSRRSAEQVMKMIKSRKATFILHWYSGPIELLDELSDNIYLSLNPAMIKSRTGKKVLRTIDLQHILLESDAPYVKMNDGQSGSFLSTRLVDTLSILRAKPAAEILKIINKNYNDIFK